MQNEHAKQLLIKYKNGTATEEEIELLLSWIQNLETNSQVDFSEHELIKIGNEIWKKAHPEKANVRFIKTWQIAAAASILLFISAGVFILKMENKEPSISQNKHFELLPGTNKAILTLGNGKQISLTGAKKGIIAHQGNTPILNQAAGLITYVSEKNKLKTDSNVDLNIVSTPRGGQYQVILPDKSHVWLNASSSITFPVAFIGKKRKVEITGEAYFEVTHNKSQPFIVTAAGQTVQVLGTHFNINAYKDEPSIKTTLLQGSVKVNYLSASALLKPGESSTVYLNKRNITVNTDDADEAVAWKDGYFEFNHADVKTVMRQLSRWYDVNVSYEGKPSNEDFGGDIQRDLNLSQVLSILQKSNVHFIIKGKEVIVKE